MDNKRVDLPSSGKIEEKKQAIKRLKIEAYGHSDQGPVRPNNEDVWLSLPTERFFALADGMGGHQAGEVAAKETLNHLTLSIQDKKRPKTPCLEFISFLKKAIQSANTHVFEMSLLHEKFKGMGTTLCLLYLHEDGVIYAHVGDSRIYRYRRGELKQLTQDHALASPLKNVITRAIGTSKKVLPEIASATAKAGDIFFMCSDGLTDFVSEKEIENILFHSTSLKKIVKKLIEKAKEKGSNDNITILMIKVAHARKKNYLFR